MDGFDGFVGQAAAGRVQVELCADGTLRDIFLDPRVAYLPIEELREALVTAFTQAQEQARSSEYTTTAAPQELTDALTEASDLAERRFAEVSTALFDLTRRAGRSW